MNNILPKTHEELKNGGTKLKNDAPEPEGAHDVQMSDAKEISPHDVSPISDISPVNKRASREIPDQNFAQEVTKGDRENDPQVKVMKKDQRNSRSGDREDEAQVSDIDEPKEESHTITIEIPEKMKAIKIVEGGKAELQSVPVPALRDDYILCKVNCVALNPTDWKHIDKVGKPGSTVGVDMSGMVLEIGDKVKKDWQVGDRIAAFVHGGNESQHEDGAFGEFAVAKGDLGLKIPDGMSDTDAATLPTGVITCGQALYQSLALPLPGDGMEKYGGFLLVYGGSTATGTLAIQYGILSGCRVITTASEHNHPLLKALGAEEAFDYKDPSCAQKIKEYTNDDLRKVLDCISEGDSPKICEQSISSQGGEISYLLKTKHSREDVENKHTLGYTITGEAFKKMGKKMDAKPEDFEHAKKFFELTQKLVNAGQLAVHPAEVGEDGLKGVFEGLDRMRKGDVSGRKLVYRVGQTPK